MERHAAHAGIRVATRLRIRVKGPGGPSFANAKGGLTMIGPNNSLRTISFRGSGILPARRAGLRGTPYLIQASDRVGRPGEAKRKRVSALDAAAQVLAKAKEPMGAKALIEAMAEQTLWKSPGGATPWATLYAAMLREIGAKGQDARFTKVDRGLFAFNG